MKKAFLLVGIHVFAFAVLVRADAAPVAPAKHLADAMTLVQHLRLENTSYRHGQGQVQWEPVCISHADCSGFLGALLMHSYGFSWDDFKKWFGSSRPTARRYHDTIAKRIGFNQVMQVRDIHPGDIIAVKFPPGGSNTGHVMLAVNVPQRISAKEPLVSNTEQWELEVIDSSRSGHGQLDTRHG